MNTPKPCDTCERCKYNCITKDDPCDSAYCIAYDFITENSKKRPLWGDEDCPFYVRDKRHDQV